MRKTARLLQIAAVSFSVSVAIAAQTDWKGSYYFGEDGGKNAGGIALLISHELEIFDGDE